MTIRVSLAATAWHDLDEIYDWIEDHSDPETALDYSVRILRLCSSLTSFPNRGTPRNDLGENVRTIGFERRATIVYRVYEDVVTVLRVFHHGRDASHAFRP